MGNLFQKIAINIMEVKYKNTKLNFEINESEDGDNLHRDGLTIKTEGSIVNNNTFRVKFNGRWVKAYVADDDSRYYVWIEGRQLVFDKVKDEEKSFDTTDTTSGDIQLVYAPMPGSIVKVMVEQGQKVLEGNPLIIVEAMKMETTIYSSIDGIVTEINANQGEQVNTDKILIKVEKEIG
jgi:biotin carboxyl carrier protein